MNRSRINNCLKHMSSVLYGRLTMAYGSVVSFTIGDVSKPGCRGVVAGVVNALEELGVVMRRTRSSNTTVYIIPKPNAVIISDLLTGEPKIINLDGDAGAVLAELWNARSQEALMKVLEKVLNSRGRVNGGGEGEEGVSIL